MKPRDKLNTALGLAKAARELAAYRRQQREAAELDAIARSEFMRGA